MALGFCLSELEREGADTGSRRGRLTYVEVNGRCKNLGCFKSQGDYRPPRRAQVAVHYVKSASAQQYVWRMMQQPPHNRITHDPELCAEMAGVS